MKHHPLRDALPLVTVVLAALSAATAASALSLFIAPIGVADRSTVFAEPVSPDERDLLLTTGREGLTATLGEAPIEDPFMVDTEGPVPVCADGVACAPVPDAAPDANERPRRLPVLITSHVVNIIDGVGQRAAFDLLTGKRQVLDPVGPAWPEVVEADHGSGLVIDGAKPRLPGGGSSNRR
jgi:hypothetical protein